MVQTRFKKTPIKVNEGAKKEFYSLIDKIFSDLYQEINNKLVFDDLVIQGKPIERIDTNLKEAPEPITKRLIIEPFLRYLGYEIHLESAPESKEKRDEADYADVLGGDKVLIEAEPLNKDLKAKKTGINQVGTYLEMRSFKADYGIATNGFEWALVRYDADEYKVKVLHVINISPFFKKLAGQESIGDLDELFRDFYFTFSKAHVFQTARSKFELLEESSERITKHFYEDYIKYVFGVIKESDTRAQSLLTLMVPPQNVREEDKRLFAVNLMNRLIFIKFLEDKGLVEVKLLRNILKQYKEKGVPVSFYRAYLQILFYEVFNTPVNKRKSNVNSIDAFKKIPYLNGGLFRECVPKEKEYDVDNIVLEKIITDLLEKYSFTLNGDNRSLNPDILGNVFEKTINYISSEDIFDSNKRKEIGAYYTRENITSFISKNTIHPKIFSLVKDVLKKDGWKDADIAAYSSFADVLDNLPANPKTLNEIYNQIDKVKILDPACGSGHFLTSSLKEIFFIKKRILEKLNKSPGYYVVKKEIIKSNLYGVDIELSAVEIAKLRLWLSLIEEMDTTDLAHVDSLPNIEYNIIGGNSLVGWLNEELAQNINIFSDEHIRGIFEGLKLAYADNPEKYNLLIRAEELIFNPQGQIVTSFKEAYFNLRVLYSMEDGEKAVRLREILTTIKKSIYSGITPVYKNYIIEKKNSKRMKKQGTIDKYFVPNQFHWNIDFGDVFDNGGFDIILGNPPYGAKISINERRYLDHTLPVSAQYFNSALAFIERSYYMVGNDGLIGLIVPKSLTYSYGWGVGRKLIEEDLQIIVDVSKAFKDVKLEQVIFVLKKGVKCKEYVIASIESTEATAMDKKYIEQTNTIPLVSKKSDLDLCIKIYNNSIPLGTISDACRGLPYQKYAKNIKTKYPMYRGDHIKKYGLRNTDSYVDESVIKEDSSKVLTLTRPKILLQQIVAHVTRPQPHLLFIASYDRNSVLNFDTIENVFLRNTDYSYEFITCLLNSKLISWYASRFIFANAIRTMHIDEYYVSKIPIPKESEKTQEFKKLYEEIEKQVIEGKGITELERTVNNKIYELFELTDEEIGLIESNFNKPNTL